MRVEITIGDKTLRTNLWAVMLYVLGVAVLFSAGESVLDGVVARLTEQPPQ